jgi:hypothetical protein
MTDLRQAAQRLIELGEERTPGTWGVKRVHGKRFDVDAYDMERIVGFVCERSTSKNDPDFISHTANHAPAIARDYLAKCEEVERLRQSLQTIAERHRLDSAEIARQALGDTDDQAG